MDLMKDLMNINKPLQKIRVPTGQVDGRLLIENDSFSSDDDDEHLHMEKVRSNNYAQEYRNKELKLYAELRNKKENNYTVVDHAEDLLSSMGRVDVHQLHEDEIKETYKKYSFDKKSIDSLSIEQYRQEILSLIAVNAVVIIQGRTGCGKTTRVPQFILDECQKLDKPCKIIVTQPRRIAAISVAKRVCEERGWPLGEVCGYQVGLEKKTSFDTLLSYVTTGVLLQKLVKEKTLNDYTHIIIDEVHERNQDMDFLLLLARRFLFTNSPNTKVVLMSATLDAVEFAEYFKNAHDTRVLPPPVLNIDKPPKFNIQKFYADQLSFSAEVATFKPDEPKIDPSTYNLCALLTRAFDKLDPIDPITNEMKIGHVLVFLPGILEIEEAHDYLINHLREDEEKFKDITTWSVLPLHSSITIEEQRRVFLPPPPGQRKIILSTNIAESSITVSDITYVIDFCLTKTMLMDPDTQFQTLQLQWASHVNCTQRAGRVGRVCDGRVYRLIPSQFYEYYLPKTVTPEILRAPLNHVVLASKLLDLKEPPKAILALAMNPPILESIDNTVLYLKEIGALTVYQDGKQIMNDGDLTFLGEIMALLPLDVHLSKFIFLGHIFSCLQDAIIMATGCSLSIFKAPFKERLKAYTSRLQWADGSASDLVAYLHLYNVWQRKKRLRPNPQAEKLWCEKNFVTRRSLNEWHILVKEIQARLSHKNIHAEEGPGNVVHSETELPILVKVVMCGAFYPNYFKRSPDAGQIDEREAVKTLGGRDPFQTVYFTGFDYKQPGPLYANSIKGILQECATDMHVTFDNTSKVYVDFKSPNFESIVIDGQKFVTTMPGKIRTEVYRAVRRRQLNLIHKIPIMSADKAWSIAKSIGVQPMAHQSQTLPLLERSSSSLNDSPLMAHPTVIPSLDMTHLILKISHRIDAGHFWAQLQNDNESTNTLLFDLYKDLNGYSVELKPLGQKSVVVGKLYAAKYSNDKMFYRCKVISLNSLGKNRATLAQVLFIDYGNTEMVELSELVLLPDTHLMLSPAQAIECYLSQIQPSMVLNPRALWSEDAIKQFDTHTNNQILSAKIYSVVNEVVHLELYPYSNVGSNFEFKNSINNWLIDKGYAEPAEESFLSKENHTKRMVCVEHPEQLLSFSQDASESNDSVSYDLPRGACNDSLVLKGPYSPLEMQIFGVTASGANNSIKIEGSSVNAVLLDTDPQDPHERLIVAAHIGQNRSGTTLNLRHTTVMPNIRGFPMLMSLLFCPAMEPKPIADGTRIGAILCGVGGYANTHKSMFPPHDICLTLDTELTVSDLNEINRLRHWMNHAVQVMEFYCRGIPPSTSMSYCQREIKQQLLQILKAKRHSVERVYVKHANVWGQTLYDSEILQADTQCNYAQIWPLHWFVKLNPQKEEAAMYNNIIAMEEVALGMRKVNEIKCMYCNYLSSTTIQMRIHLASKAHKEAVLKYDQRSNT